ncbi:hypothetical protein MU0083_001064 [[Mycobacterium] kokjensenii]|uniref:Facilitated glucose transporter n=1 Tax=[Mycobacterium] kokjensenii TaxID=3064287 RepID=A0ABM9L9H1_9MYCO|nr:hypothetical protein [Mycolicibacter sp. MU0083]CAJ1495199.1 hypothetical protein MU0083_001064 [Mycolicibacter sp. MU0083]
MPAIPSLTPHPAFNVPVLALLAFDGVLCAVATALLLPAHIGAVPFPISALIGGLVNAGLVWVALGCTHSLRVAALPLWGWLLAIALMTLGGPGDDLIFADRGLMAYGVLLMIVVGSAPPVWVLWRRREALAAGNAPARQS